MWYRCRVCRLVEERGCLPGVSCCLYLYALIAMSLGLCIVGVRWLRSMAGASGADQVAEEPIPWWVWLIGPLLTCGAVLLVAVALNFLLQAVEYLAFVRRSCLNCGARRWSWGYTRGFGP
jgi:hypothetical protein